MWLQLGVAVDTPLSNRRRVNKYSLREFTWRNGETEKAKRVAREIFKFEACA